MHSLNLRRQLGGFLREAPIKVFAGSEKNVYYVHPGVLLACKSSTAAVRMSGHWKETGDSAIDWTDFDRQTIECVLQYLYTGDYYVPDFGDETSTPVTGCAEIGPEQTEGAVHTEEPPPTDEEHVPSQSPLPDENPLGRPLTPIQECVEAAFPSESVQTAAGVVAEKGFERDQYAVRVSILTHARVYSFAHRHFFSDLAKLALQRLTQILNLASCECTALFPHLGDAIRHIYNTVPGPEMQADPARNLLSQYVALNYTSLAGEKLDALVEEGGELMVDVSNKLVRLLATKTSQVCSLEDRIGSLSAGVEALQVICNDKETEIQLLLARQETELQSRSGSKKQKKSGNLF